MEFKIPLPSANSINTYSELNAYLKQLELAVHYAQKSVKNAEDMGIKLTEDTIVDFDFPSIEEKDKDDNYEYYQNIELRINIQ